MKKLLFGNLKFKTSEFSNSQVILPYKEGTRKILEKEIQDIKKKIVITNKSIFNLTKEKIALKNIQANNPQNFDNLEIKIIETENLENENRYIREELFQQIKNADEKISDIKFVKKIFTPSSKEHGFSGIILEDKIAFTCHTSRPFSFIWNTELENIAMSENLNPIKNVNKMQVITKSDFIKFYKVTGPDKLWSSYRYGKIEKKDLAYCSLRALKKSIDNSQQILMIQEDNKNIIAEVHDKIYINPENESLLPSQMALKNNDEPISPDILEELNNFIETNKDNDKGKEGLIEILSTNFKEWLKQ